MKVPILSEPGFDPMARLWWVRCPECVERIYFACEGQTGTFYPVCAPCGITMCADVTIARMR